MHSRRKILQVLATAAAPTSLSGCLRLKDIQPDCSISWSPSLLDPVFYGVKSYPDACVFYPSLEGTPQGAKVLRMCGKYPLILFVHGDCGGADCESWQLLASRLASAGNVVAIPTAPSALWDGDASTTAELRSVYGWMRTSWEYRDVLMAPPNTVVMGHSYGGTLAAALVTQIPVAAMVSLSGVFGEVEFTTAQLLLRSISVPCLFMWGTGSSDTDANIKNWGWDLIPKLKNAVVYLGGEHADYIPADSGSCQGVTTRGPCPLVPELAADFAATFCTKYCWPQNAFFVNSYIPDNLFVTPQTLPATSQGGYYAGPRLTGFARSKLLLANVPPCNEDLYWDTASSAGYARLAS